MPFTWDLAILAACGRWPRSSYALCANDCVRRPPSRRRRIDQLLADLDSRDFGKRQTRQFRTGRKDRGRPPRLSARRSLRNPHWNSGDASNRYYSDSTQRARQSNSADLRAVRLLEEMDSAESRALLKTLSQGDQRFLLTREAKAASQATSMPGEV